MHEQVLQKNKRFVDDLPVLEKVLQEEGLPADISNLDLGILSRVGEDKKPVRADHFL